MTSIFEIQCFLTMFDQPAIWSVVGIPNFFRKRKCKSNYDVVGGMRVGGNYRFEVCNLIKNDSFSSLF